MGTQYYIGCLECKVYRELDKHMGGCLATPQDRNEALNYAEEEIEEQAFRYGLLVSFLLDHASHYCKFFDDHYNVTDNWRPVIDGVELRSEKNKFW